MSTHNNKALHYPFPYAINVHSNTIEEKIASWLENDYIFLPENVKLKYLNTAIGHAGGCMFPNANEEQLTAICRFFLWAFIIDDSFEFSTQDSLEIIRRKSMTALKSNNSNVEKLYTHLPLLRQELLKLSTEVWLSRFFESLEVYFDGIGEEVPFRQSMRFPSWDQFLSIRERAVNVYPLINFAEMITATVLPDDILQHPIIKEIGRLTCRILSWSNDYFSAHMEKGNDVLNVVLMMEHIKGCTLSEAYQLAVDYHDQDLSRYCTLLESLPDFGIYDQTVKSYTTNLSLMIHGYLHWTLSFTGRYQTDGAGHPVHDLKYKQPVKP